MQKGDGLKRLELAHGPTPLHEAITSCFSHKKDDPSTEVPPRRVNRGAEEAASSPPFPPTQGGITGFGEYRLKSKRKSLFYRYISYALHVCLKRATL